MQLDIYDTGEQYADRYVCVLRTERHAHTWYMSWNANSANGVCYHGGVRPRRWQPPRAKQVDDAPIGVLRQCVNLARGAFPVSNIDTTAMDNIHRLLDGREWDSDTIAAVAEIVQQSGRDIRDAGEFCEPGEFER